MKWFDFLLIYLLIVNVIGLLVMFIDKQKAKKHLWRIPEKVLFIVSLIGGSLGSWAGMYIFHHKTKHWYFVVGMPAILVLQLALGIFLRVKFL